MFSFNSAPLSWFSSCFIDAGRFSFPFPLVFPMTRRAYYGHTRVPAMIDVSACTAVETTFFGMDNFSTLVIFCHIISCMSTSCRKPRRHRGANIHLTMLFPRYAWAPHRLGHNYRLGHALDPQDNGNSVYGDLTTHMGTCIRRNENAALEQKMAKQL